MATADESSTTIPLVPPVTDAIAEVFDVPVNSLSVSKAMIQPEARWAFNMRVAGDGACRNTQENSVVVCACVIELGDGRADNIGGGKHGSEADRSRIHDTAVYRDYPQRADRGRARKVGPAAYINPELVPEE